MPSRGSGFGSDVEDLPGLDRLHCMAQHFRDWLVVFTSLAQGVHNYGAKGQLLEVVLELETTVKGDEDIEVSLRELNHIYQDGYSARSCSLDISRH